MDKPTGSLTAAAVQPRRLNFRWHVLIWLLIGGMINYMDRASLSIAAPGTTIHLQPDLQRAHLFDAGTGQRLVA